MRPTPRPVLALSLLGLAAPGALAQDAPPAAAQDEAPAPEREESGSITTITHEEGSSWVISAPSAAGVGFIDEADFDSDIGTFRYSELRAGILANGELGDTARLSIAFDVGLIDYDIDTSPTSVAGDAASISSELDNVTTLSLISTYSDRLNDTTSWFVMGGVLSGRENNADFGDSLDGLLGGGFRYKVNDRLRVGLGVIVRTRLDDDVLIVPVPQIQYTISDRWTLASERAGLKLNYKASDTLDYGVSGEYASTTFRLDDAHAAAPGGMATHRSFPVAFYAAYAPSSTFKITGRIGGLLAGELEILDTDGGGVAAEDIETQVFGSLSLSFLF